MEKFNQPNKDRVEHKGMTLTEMGFQPSKGLTPPIWVTGRPDGNSEISVNPDYLLENFEIRNILTLFNTGNQDFSKKTADSYVTVTPAIVTITQNGSFSVVQKGELRLKSGGQEASAYVSSKEITPEGNTRFTIKIPKKEVAQEPLPEQAKEVSKENGEWTEEDERELEALSKIISTNTEVINRAEKRLAEIKALLETKETEGGLEFIADSGAASLVKMNPETKEVAKENQDSYFSSTQTGSFAVLDGVGGHAGGNIASSMASGIIRDEMESMGVDLTEQERAQYIENAVHKANNAILEKIKTSPELKGMATTLSFTHIFEDKEGNQKAIVVNLGDSRVYTLRTDGVLEQITQDGSWIRFQLELSKKPEEEIARVEEIINNAETEEELGEENIVYWNKRNSIVESLGEKELKVNTKILDLKDIRKIIISSDGVHDILTERKIDEIANKKQSSADTAKELTETAQRENYGFRQKKHGDDITAVVIEIKK